MAVPCGARQRTRHPHGTPERWAHGRCNTRGCGYTSTNCTRCAHLLRHLLILILNLTLTLTLTEGGGGGGRLAPRRSHSRAAGVEKKVHHVVVLSRACSIGVQCVAIEPPFSHWYAREGGDSCRRSVPGFRRPHKHLTLPLHVPGFRPHASTPFVVATAHCSVDHITTLPFLCMYRAPPRRNTAGRTLKGWCVMSLRSR
jgi:hypothetical protein